MPLTGSEIQLPPMPSEPMKPDGKPRRTSSAFKSEPREHQHLPASARAANQQISTSSSLLQLVSRPKKLSFARLLRPCQQVSPDDTSAGALLSGVRRPGARPVFFSAFCEAPRSMRVLLVLIPGLGMVTTCHHCFPTHKWPQNQIARFWRFVLPMGVPYRRK